MFFQRSKNNNSLSDLDLVLLYKTTDDTAHAGELFSRYSHLVFGVCIKYLKSEEESRDAVMNIFEKLLQDLKKHNISNFKSWLHTVARNHCLMLLRARKPLVINSEKTDVEGMEYSFSLHQYDSEPELELRLGSLEDCMNKLIDEQKVCVELFYMKERCYKEITELTKYSLNEVKSYIQNGKRNLKNCMSKKDE